MKVLYAMPSDESIEKIAREYCRLMGLDPAYGSVYPDGSSGVLIQMHQPQLATAIAVVRQHIAIDLAIKNTSAMP
jgi:hypothetical protein